MSVREENIRLRIEAVSELPTLSDQYSELIRLTKQHADVMVQSAQLIKAQIAEEGAAVRAQTDEYKRQEAAQRAAATAARTAATEAKNAAKEVAEELKRQTAAQQALTDAERATAVAARAAAIAQRGDIKGVSDEINQANQSVRTFTTLLAAAFTLSAVKSFGNDVIDAKTRIDSLQIALTTMLGSRREADELYAKVVTLAKTTPFSLAEVGDQVAKLKAYNIATEDLIPTITALGNMAAAVGKEKLPQLTLAYGQIANTGRLMGTELKQLTEAGIPVFDLLATSMGKTKKEIIELQAANAITFADIRKAFMDASEAGGKYAGLMANVSKTVGGQISNLADAYDVAKARIGNFFEDQIKSGTRLMGELIETLIGSESAIKRTSLAVASAVTVFTTFRIATTAQALATAALSGGQAAGAFIAGTYNLVMLTLKGTTEGLTRAQLESAVAARSSFAVIAANPVGAFVTVVGLAVAAVLAWKAAQEDISVTMGQQEFDLRKGQDEINRMVEAAIKLKDTDVRRKEAIQDLIAKYPEYFSGLNTEKVTNDQLRGILNEVNKSYSARIVLAKEAYNVEKLNENRRKLWDEEAESIKRLNERLPELRQYGTDTDKILDVFNKNIDKFKQAKGGENPWDIVDNIFNGNPVDAMLRARKGLSDIETELKASDARVLAATSKSRDIDIANTHAFYDRQIKAAGSNKAEIARLKQEENDAIDKINGTFRKKDLIDTGDHNEKLKKVILLSANEIKLIKQGNDEGEQMDRMKQLKDQLAYLETLEKAEIDSATKITVNKKISNAQLAALKEKSRQEVAAIDAKYDQKRAEILIQIEEQNQKDFLLKIKETQEKVEVLTVKRLEAERILTALNTAQTEEERLSVMKEYNKKINVSVQEQATAQLKIQVDASKKALDAIIAKDGERGDAYRKAYETWLKDNSQYETALTQQAIEATKSRVDAIVALEKEIQDTKKETAKINAETLKIYEQSGRQMLNLGLDLLSQQSGLIGELSRGIKVVYANLDGLSGKATEAARNQLTDAQNNLKLIRALYDDNGQRTQLDIAKAEKQVAESENKLAKVSSDSAAAALGVFQVVYQIANAVAAAYNQMMADTYQAIAEGLGKARDAYASLYDFIQQAAADAYKAEMDAFNGSLTERLAKIDAYYAKEKEFAVGRDRIDAMLAYNQEVAQLMAKQGQNAGDIIRGLIAARENQAQREGELAIQSAELSIQKAADVRDARIRFIDDALKKFTETINAEIAAEQAGLDARKALNEQFYSDKQLRLQEDDVYRALLLAQGEAREVAALEAAKQRELQRAMESGATQEELARITVAFDKLIADKHEEYQTAVGKKTKETSLANQEAKAQEKDKVNTLEQESKNIITGLQQQIKQQEIQAAADKKAANEDYANAVMRANKEIFEANRRMKIAELEAEIAILRSKRNIFNQGKIDAAIGDLNAAIGSIQGINFATGQVSLGGAISGAFNQIFAALGISNKPVRADNGADPGPVFDSKGNPMELTYNSSGKKITVYDAAGQPFEVAYADGYVPKTGERFYKGTPYVEGLGYPSGIDTVPAMLTKGERVLSTEHNAALSGITNDDLVSRSSFYERFAAQFPQLLDPSRWSDIHMQLPAGVMNGSGGSTLDLSQMVGEMQGFRKDLKSFRPVTITNDRNGTAIYTKGVQSKIQHIDAIFKG